MIASRRRRLLAWYVDLLVLPAIIGLATFVARVEGPPPAAWAAGLALFLVVRMALARLATTPGIRVLAIDASGQVDPRIAARESWTSMIFATVLMLEGSKLVVRWADHAAAPSPLFGWLPEAGVAASLAVVQGGLLIAIAMLLYRMMTQGWWLALVGVALSTASFLMSPTAMLTAGTLRHASRREGTGVPVTAEHAEAIQGVIGSWGPMSVVGLYAAAAIGLLVVRRSYMRPRQASP